VRREVWEDVTPTCPSRLSSQVLEEPVRVIGGQTWEIVRLEPDSSKLTEDGIALVTIRHNSPSAK
jgi:hypothetical protein